MRVRQLLSIELSNMCVIKENNRHFSEDLIWISALVSFKRIVYNFENLVHVITKPLVALGASTPTDLLEANNTHTITGNAFKLKFGRHCSDEHIIALNRLSALLNTDLSTVTKQDITQEIFQHRSKGCSTLTEDRKVNTAPMAIEGLCQAFEQERTERQATIRVRTLCPTPNIIPMPTHTPHNAPPTFQRHPVILRRVRKQQSASQPTPGIIHNNVQRANQILSQQPLQGHHTEAMDTEEQPTKNIRPAAVGSEQIKCCDHT